MKKYLAAILLAATIPSAFAERVFDDDQCIFFGALSASILEKRKENSAPPKSKLIGMIDQELKDKRLRPHVYAGLKAAIELGYQESLATDPDQLGWEVVESCAKVER